MRLGVNTVLPTEFHMRLRKPSENEGWVAARHRRSINAVREAYNRGRMPGELARMAEGIVLRVSKEK